MWGRKHGSKRWSDMLKYRMSVGRQDMSSSYGSTQSQLLQPDRASELPPVWNELEYKLQIYCECAKLVLSEEDHRML